MNKKTITFKQRKALKPMFDHLIETFRSVDVAGTMLAIYLDAFDKLVEKKDEQEIRTLEIRVNDFFSYKYNFLKGKVVDER